MRRIRRQLLCAIAITISAFILGVASTVIQVSTQCVLGNLVVCAGVDYSLSTLHTTDNRWNRRHCDKLHVIATGWRIMVYYHQYKPTNTPSLGPFDCLGFEFDDHRTVIASQSWRTVILRIPLWLPILLPLLYLCRSVVRSRKVRPYPLCNHCGYNLLGNESGVCPECGRRTRSNFRRVRP